MATAYAWYWRCKMERSWRPLTPGIGDLIWGKVMATNNQLARRCGHTPGIGDLIWGKVMATNNQLARRCGHTPGIGDVIW
jgi:hypothetical protein